MNWAKLHTDILGDPKLMRAVRHGAKSLFVLPWLIAFAKEADNDGRLTVGEYPADADDIAPLIPNVTRDQVAECLASLEEIGVLERDDDDVLRFAKWEKRSRKPSDSPAAIRGRVQKHRRAKAKAADCKHETPRNAASNALQNREVTSCNATDRGEENREEEKQQAAGESTASPMDGVGETPSATGNAPIDAVPCVPYLTRCVMALNFGMQQNALTAPAFMEIATSTQVAQVDWERDGIHIETVERVIADACASFKPRAGGKQINSLKYFDSPVRERWAQLLNAGDVARALAKNGTTPFASSPERAAMLRKQGY